MSASLREIDGDEAKELLAEMSRKSAGSTSLTKMMKVLGTLGEDAEENVQVAIEEAVAESEKRFRAVLERAERANAAAYSKVLESLAEGLAKVKAAMQARELQESKQAGSMAAKLAEAISDSRKLNGELQGSALAETRTALADFQKVLLEARRMQSESLAQIADELAAIPMRFGTEMKAHHAETRHAIEAAVAKVKIEPPPRKGFSVSITARDSAGFAKTLKVTPD